MPDYIFQNSGVLRGEQTPEGNVEAPTGTIYIRTVDSVVFEKRSGTGVDGWVKNTAVSGNNGVLGSATIDLNTSGDQNITINSSKYRITDIVFSEPSTGLVGSLLLGGQIRTESGGSGDRCITGIPKTLLTATNSIANATLHSDITNQILTTTTLYYRNTGLFGSSGSVDVTVYGIDLT